MKKPWEKFHKHSLAQEFSLLDYSQQGWKKILGVCFHWPDCFTVATATLLDYKIRSYAHFLRRGHVWPLLPQRWAEVFGNPLEFPWQKKTGEIFEGNLREFLRKSLEQSPNDCLGKFLRQLHGITDHLYTSGSPWERRFKTSQCVSTSFRGFQRRFRRL